MITVDIQRFSTHLAAIYSNMAKPVLDVILYNYQLSQNVGAEGLLLLTVGVQASAALRECSPHQYPSCILRFNIFVSLSPVYDTTFRPVHRPICIPRGIPPSQPFSPRRVRRRDRLPRWRRNGEDARGARVCRGRQT